MSELLWGDKNIQHLLLPCCSGPTQSWLIGTWAFRASAGLTQHKLKQDPVGSSKRYTRPHYSRFGQLPLGFKSRQENVSDQASATEAAEGGNTESTGSITAITPTTTVTHTRTMTEQETR
jgi:hypothetical protein